MSDIYINKRCTSAGASVDGDGVITVHMAWEAQSTAGLQTWEEHVGFTGEPDDDRDYLTSSEARFDAYMSAAGFDLP